MMRAMEMRRRETMVGKRETMGRSQETTVGSRETTEELSRV